MPSSRTRLGGLDGLRAVAAGLVFVCHAALFWSRETDAWDETATSAVGHLGGFGVAIFFVVSGCVIFRPFIGGGPVDVAAYARRRLARIVPAYWVALAVLALLLPAQVPGLATSDAWVFAGFLQVYVPGQLAHGLSPAWTLCVEITFYAAVPVLAMLRGRGLMLVVAGLAGSSLAVQALALAPHTSTLLGHWDWFAIGIALAWLSSGPGDRLITAAAQRRHVIWAAAAIGAWVVAAAHDPLAEHVAFGVFAGLAVLPALGSGRTRAAGWLGDRSYGIYLWHYPLLGWMSGVAADAATFLFLGGGLTLAAAAVSYRCVERPFMERARGRRSGEGVEPSQRGVATPHRL